MTTIAAYTEIQLPTWAICYIEYSDESDLSDDDAKDVDAWMASMQAMHPDGRMVLDYYGQEEYFSICPEFGLASTCVDCTATFLKP